MGTQLEIFTYVSIIAFVTTQLLFFAASDSRNPQIGVNYGTNGNNLPPPKDVVNLFHKKGINLVRIYEPNVHIFNAVKGTNIKLIVGVRNQDIPSIAKSRDAAKAWVNTNIVPWKDDVCFYFVIVGNEVIPGPLAAHVAQAITNIKSALVSIGKSNIYVSTNNLYNLQISFPPSAGKFPPDVARIMKDVARVLTANKTPLLVSVYPYFAYASNPKDIPLNYALFNATTPVVDGPNQYFNLFEAQIDAYYAALATVGGRDIPIIIAETGWPTAGKEPITSVANARTFNNNLIKRVKSRKGTPRAPSIYLDALIFGLFDENLKPKGIEQHWGIFSPNMEPKYPLLWF